MPIETSETDDPNNPANGLSKKDLRHLIEQFEELERDFGEMETRLEPLIDRRLRELAGPELDAMLLSEEATLNYLNHANPNLRQASLQLAYSHWYITKKLAIEYERIAITDPDTDVRETAIRAIGTCHAGSSDRRIGQLLACVVRNDSLSEGMRLTAFCSLLRVIGIMDYRGNSPLVPRLLSEVDWDLVDEFQQEE